MPVLTADIFTSFRTESSCDVTSFSEKGWMALTAMVFCDVAAVMTEQPCRSMDEMALMSAWTPAPPMGSDPATVITTRMLVYPARK